MYITQTTIQQKRNTRILTVHKTNSRISNSNDNGCGMKVSATAFSSTCIEAGQFLLDNSNAILFSL